MVERCGRPRAALPATPASALVPPPSLPWRRCASLCACSCNCFCCSRYRCSNLICCERRVPHRRPSAHTPYAALVVEPVRRVARGGTGTQACVDTPACPDTIHLPRAGTTRRGRACCSSVCSVRMPRGGGGFLRRGEGRHAGPAVRDAHLVHLARCIER